MALAIDSQRAGGRGRHETGTVIANDEGSDPQSRRYHHARVKGHANGRDSEHDHDHDHDHEHDHPRSGLIGVLRGFVAPHSHDAKASLDQALEGSRDGIRAVAISLVVLLLTAGVQALVVVASGSVALLGDTLHNAADALTAIPLWLAFRLGRRAPTSRFTYGYGKAEDVAGVVVLALIVGSAVLAGYEAVDRLIRPQKITDLGFVMAAAVVGAVGNELVAQYRIRVGRRIGSAALEADGIHARTDGVTSLLVLIGAVAVALGAQWADAVVGLVITAAILVVGYQAARSVGQRLLDAVDPAIVARISEIVAAVPGVLAVTEVRARWMGHRLLAQVRLSVDGTLSVARSHEIAEVAHHELLHDISNLSDAIIHVDPAGVKVDPHASTAHHGSSP
jgi:cation diffusion facilitator family transporter